MSDEQTVAENVDPLLAGNGMVITEEMRQQANEATQAADSSTEAPTEEAPADDQPVEEAPKEEAPEDLDIPSEEPEGDAEQQGDLIDINNFAEEFASEDGPSEETMNTLRDALGKNFANADDLIDIFRAGQAAIGQIQQASAFEVVGGAENYAAMQAWAKDLPQDQKDEFNEAIKGPARNLAIRGLYAQFSEATGRSSDAAVDTSHISSQSTVTGGLSPLVSIQQISEATADPRYDRDPAYRDEVHRRIAAGNKRG